MLEMGIGWHSSRPNERAHHQQILHRGRRGQSQPAGRGHRFDAGRVRCLRRARVNRPRLDGGLQPGQPQGPYRGRQRQRQRLLSTEQFLFQPYQVHCGRAGPQFLFQEGGQLLADPGGLQPRRPECYPGRGQERQPHGLQPGGQRQHNTAGP